MLGNCNERFEGVTSAVFGSTNCVILIVLDAKVALLAVPVVTGVGKAQTLGAVPVMVNCVEPKSAPEPLG